MEKLRDLFVRETDQAKLKEIAESIQVRATEWTPYIHLGHAVVCRAQEHHGLYSCRPYSVLERRKAMRDQRVCPRVILDIGSLIRQ
jgi:hypothetical protein